MDIDSIVKNMKNLFVPSSKTTKSGTLYEPKYYELMKARGIDPEKYMDKSKVRVMKWKCSECGHVSEDNVFLHEFNFWGEKKLIRQCDKCPNMMTAFLRVHKKQFHPTNQILFE